MTPLGPRRITSGDAISVQVAPAVFLFKVWLGLRAVSMDFNCTLGGHYYNTVKQCKCESHAKSIYPINSCLPHHSSYIGKNDMEPYYIGKSTDKVDIEDCDVGTDCYSIGHALDTCLIRTISLPGGDLLKLYTVLQQVLTLHHSHIPC